VNKYKVGDLIQSPAHGIGLIEEICKDGWYWVNYFKDPYCKEGNRRGYKIKHGDIVFNSSSVELLYNPQ
tara:strand:+ start:72 stop:278 length:207 start_codon:yes stop_codon:yes gene_type:complete